MFLILNLKMQSLKKKFEEKDGVFKRLNIFMKGQIYYNNCKYALLHYFKSEQDIKIWRYALLHYFKKGIDTFQLVLHSIRNVFLCISVFTKYLVIKVAQFPTVRLTDNCDTFWYHRSYSQAHKAICRLLNKAISLLKVLRIWSLVALVFVSNLRIGSYQLSTLRNIGNQAINGSLFDSPKLQK